MTIEEFTQKADGIINDFIGGITDGKEFRDDILDLLIEVAKKVIPMDAGIGMPSETLSCEQVRNNTIEECAKHLEELAEKANDVLVEERHILQADTVELFRNDIDHARRLANNLRELASKP